MTAGGHLSAIGNRSHRGPSPDHSVVLGLQKELQEERTTVAALEKERDFYFGKLRDIEVLIQQDLERAPESADNALLKEIQAVLYSTEEGFEIPAEEVAAEEYPDETF
ncbi:Microtubule-associated protein RP/EB member 1 [Mortierella alpina]|nr:Microtubule-associated protein RP/EB member 1 [Mortierella alpina]